jgi:hypothetical protein
VIADEGPGAIRFGAYLAAPEGKVWPDGACRWRVTGPGVSRLTRLLRRADAMGEVYRWLQETGMGGVRPAAWVEVVPQEPLKRKTYRQVEAEEPLPAWVVVDEGKPLGVCIVAYCGAVVVTRRLCGAHDRKARAQGIRERIGPPAVVKAKGVWR